MYNVSNHMETFSFWSLVLGFANSLISVLIKPFIKIYKYLYEISPFRIVRKKFIPRLGIIESSWRDHEWNYGKRGDQEIIFIYTHWQITNILPYNITGLNAFLVKPERVKGLVLIKRHDQDIWGHYTIPKNCTTEMEISFVIDKKFAKRKEEIIKGKIEIQDPIGRKHFIDQVIINPPKKALKKLNQDHLKIEDPSKIKNNIEKQVVAVLKNEVEQYKVRGRREGRLGTVEWPRGTTEYRGVDEEIKFLFENSKKENVSSKYIAALLNLYNNSSKNEQALIIKSLLKRINKEIEYRDIGYLIVFFLFEIGSLKEALNAVLKKLKGDKANAFGDVLRILDLLLTFRYEEFEEQELNEVEKFTYSTKDHPFKIKERVNAVRVLKMLNYKNNQK